MRYTYGTSEKAASRLENIARFFNPLAVRFIRYYIKGQVDSAIDLGCGPGFTTDMLSKAVQCSHVYGLDNSAHFLGLAKARFKHCAFIRHDVTKIPFPARGEVIYARFLLSHLTDVVELVNQWLGELHTGGILFIEEIEDIETEVEVFRRYLEIADGLVASEGAILYIGGLLANGIYKADMLCSECISIPVASSQAASWFLPNTVTIWEKEPFVLRNTTSAERKMISSELSGIRESDASGKDIVWKMRRLVLINRNSNIKYKSSFPRIKRKS